MPWLSHSDRRWIAKSTELGPLFPGCPTCTTIASQEEEEGTVSTRFKVVVRARGLPPQPPPRPLAQSRPRRAQSRTAKVRLRSTGARLSSTGLRLSSAATGACTTKGTLLAAALTAQSPAASPSSVSHRQDTPLLDRCATENLRVHIGEASDVAAVVFLHTGAVDPGKSPRSSLYDRRGGVDLLRRDVASFRGCPT